MSLNLNAFAGKVVTAGVTVQQAVTIISEVVSLIITVEQAAQDLAGSDKFQAVMAGVDTLLSQMSLTNVADKVKQSLAPIISVIVSLFNLLKLWPDMAPQVKAATVTISSAVATAAATAATMAGAGGASPQPNPAGSGS